MPRIFFVISVAVLAFLYGFVARHWNLFPSGPMLAAISDLRTLAQRTSKHHLGPIVYQESGVSVIDEARIAPGTTMITSYWPEFDWGTGIRMIDVDGDTLHRWRVVPDEIFGPPPRQIGRYQYIHGAHVFPNGDALFNIEMRGVARVDACGEVIWALQNESHHSIAEGEDGNFWIPGLELYTGDSEADREVLARFPGLRTPFFDDLLRQISPDGEVLQELSVLQILYRNGLQRYLAKQDLKKGDVTHLNDIEPLPTAIADQYPLFEAGDLVVSLRFPHLVFVVNPESGVVKWHESDLIIEQHDPDFIGDGWIGIFDNNMNNTDRGEMLGGSRIAAVRPHTGETEILYPTQGAQPFYTAWAGKWQQLDNGNRLITEARPGRVFEVTPDGELVWQWVHEPYDNQHVTEVKEGSRYPYTAEQIAAWACSPE